jgi:5-methylcytosine-specific restriction endonuclease McrA
MAMIAGKTKSEILAMKLWTRKRWYKTISSEEKEEAMKIVEIARRAKLSVSHTGKTHTKKTKDKIGKSHIGKTISEETRAKLKASWTPERRIKFGESRTGENNPNFGKSPSEETKAKKSKVAIKNWKNPEIKARHEEAMNRPEVRANISASTSGENHYNWQNGKSFESYGLEFNDNLRRQIRSRDNYTCQKCGATQEELGRKLDVHHIDYDKTNNNSENLICLCNVCHTKTNFNRVYWEEYFKRIMG